MAQWCYFVFFITAYVAVTEAAVAIQPPLEKPAHLAGEPGCYSDITETVLPYGQPISPSDGINCYQLLCQPNGNTLIESCGALGISPGYHRQEGDLTLPYPACCPTIVKDNAEEIENNLNSEIRNETDTDDIEFNEGESSGDPDLLQPELVATPDDAKAETLDEDCRENTYEYIELKIRPDDNVRQTLDRPAIQNENEINYDDQKRYADWAPTCSMARDI